MAKRNNILVIGESDTALTPFQDCLVDHADVTYCARDNAVKTLMGQIGRRFDWVVIKGDTMDREKENIVRSLGAMGFLQSDTEDHHNHKCGVEWLRDGSLQLHCCMQKKQRLRQVSTPDMCDTYDRGFVFEYHAPMKRTG